MPSRPTSVSETRLTMTGARPRFLKMTKDEAIALARSQLDKAAESCASSGDAVRIDQDFFQRNDDLMREVPAELEFLFDESAIAPHWLVSFTFPALEAGAITLKHATMNIY